MIYLTGDTHGGIDLSKLYTAKWQEQKSLTRDDYVIILGDFGGLWNANDKSVLNFFKQKRFTVLFVDGNHENFDMLYKYPTEPWNGGLIRKVTDNIFHLTRGQVFNINGNSFFTFGGASSVDKAYRRIGVSWWPQEIPNYAEIDTALENLSKVNNRVDYVLTHTCPMHIAGRFFPDKKEDQVSLTLNKFDEILAYKIWYFGHMHVDKRVDKYRCLYYDVLKLGV